MDGYDLDDTLADVEYSDADRIGLATTFRMADIEYVPEFPFVVITARTHDTAAMKRATLDWLNANQPNFKRIVYVSGSERDIIEAKARAINSLNLDSFTDNNPQILEALSTLVDVPLYLLDDGDRTLYSD